LTTKMMCGIQATADMACRPLTPEGRGWMGRGPTYLGALGARLAFFSL
jgi:hypothetical protein